MGYIRRNEASRSREALQRLSLNIGLLGPFLGIWAFDFGHFGRIWEGWTWILAQFGPIAGILAWILGHLGPILAYFGDPGIDFGHPGLNIGPILGIRAWILGHFRPISARIMNLFRMSWDWILGLNLIVGGPESEFRPFFVFFGMSEDGFINLFLAGLCPPNICELTFIKHRVIIH